MTTALICLAVLVGAGAAFVVALVCRRSGQISQQERDRAGGADEGDLSHVCLRALADEFQRDVA